MFSQKKRNSQRFRELAYPHIKFLYNMALRYTGNTHDAEDMVQETFYVALTKFHQLRDTAKCKNWLFAILRNIYLKELRLNRQKQTFEHDESVNYINVLETAAKGLDTAKIFEKKLEESQLHHIVGTLPEKYQSPILLHYMEDLSYQEISEYLDIPVGTVMSRLSRAKDLLKKAMLKAWSQHSSSEKVVELKKFQTRR